MYVYQLPSLPSRSSIWKRSFFTASSRVVKWRIRAYPWKLKKITWKYQNWKLLENLKNEKSYWKSQNFDFWWKSQPFDFFVENSPDTLKYLNFLAIFNTIIIIPKFENFDGRILRIVSNFLRFSTKNQNVEMFNKNSKFWFFVGNLKKSDKILKTLPAKIFKFWNNFIENR